MRYLITITFLFNFQYIILIIPACLWQESAIAQAPSLSCVSVNINGDVQLNWTPPSDTCGIFNSYYIYAADSLSGSYILITTIANFGQTTYIHIGAGADTSAVYYYIVNNSGCASNISDTIQADNVQPGTVMIDTVSVDPLTGLATISWIPSSLFDVNGYIIYIANAFGGWDSIATVFGRDSTFFIYPNSNAGTASESYSIAAVDQCGNTGPIGTEHNTIYLSNSLDTCQGESTLEWNEYINWINGVAEYNIYVSENGGPDSLLGTTTTTQFIHTGLVKTTTYCYIIQAVDGSGLKTSSSNIICGFTDNISNSGSAFLLTVRARDSVKNFLQWNEDGNWPGLVSYYNIYRSIDAGAYVLIDNLPFGTVSYTDSLEPLWDYRNGKGNFCYYIEPVKASGDRYGCVDTSNVVCVEQVPRFIVPNTFTPNGDGINDEFTPVKVFIDKTDYLFIIYNRWGQKIFETNDFYKGWDGINKGKRVPMGVYVYYFKFKIRKGIRIEKTGTITLLR